MQYNKTSKNMAFLRKKYSTQEERPVATKLKKMRLTSVDLVRAGANQEADICLYKSADADAPTEKERSLMKRFLRWLRSDAGDLDDDEPEAEKGSDLYRGALAESIRSIVDDETITPEEQDDMIRRSIAQYTEAILAEQRKDAVEEICDELRFDEIEELD